MHIRESDTVNSPDLEELNEDQAEQYFDRYFKERDLELLTHNCAAHTSSGHRVYLDALEA